MMNTKNADLLATASTADWLECERQQSRSEHFESLDAWLTSLWTWFWRSERLVETTFPKGELPRVRLCGLDESARQFVTDTFALGKQQSRGAIYHPVKEKLLTGYVNLSWYLAVVPRFALGAASEERGSVELKGEGDAIALWGIVESLFAPLSIPFALRGSVPTSPKDDREAWSEFESYLTVCGFDLREEVAAFRPDENGNKLWASWGMAQQVEAREKLWSAMKSQAQPHMAIHLRAWRLRTFVENYVSKTAKSPNTRKKVLNKAMERSLCGLFGGDWLKALDYLGEAPHAEEAIVTAVPSPKLYVGMEARVAEVATQTGLPEAEVRLMVEGFWDGTASASPVEKRVDCLGHYWQEFQAIHDRQTTGLTPLWGLVADYKGVDVPYTSTSPPEDTDVEAEAETYSRPIPHHPGLYREKFSGALQSQIDSLWGTTLLPRYPDRLATNLNPHYSLAEALGVALRFWHGCSLTAWFICEGPYSRTSLEGMSSYYRKSLDELARMGTPVDEALFVDLQKAGRKLGPEKPINTRETQSGFITITFSQGSRRDGFELLRDVIASHRSQWAHAYLSNYLQKRWEDEVKTLGATYIHQLHAAGKPPTLKAFAKTALHVTNSWFGGDLSGFFRTIGEKSPVTPNYERRMPKDMAQFVLSVGSRMNYHEEFRGLRDEPAQFIQLEEVLGRAPDAKEFAAGKGGWIPSLFKTDSKLWEEFVQVMNSERITFQVK